MIATLEAHMPQHRVRTRLSERPAFVPAKGRKHRREHAKTEVAYDLEDQNVKPRKIRIRRSENLANPRDARHRQRCECYLRSGVFFSVSTPRNCIRESSSEMARWRASNS